ncbi:hypothetical protein LOTGIDRAFT_172800 [Lottia gigantea]|uniref:small monomeric GTPase n=1 Tax=Lottia gigantea TaxID=225164 RepID=V4B520_LOTGI|nr:hypothetical protein LOTGIDRAFT_172800 [Lottia gigantea]ESP01067.1 hypothetical protein LOTGIDRAFT_172800 [Lottia gigantea]
MKAKVSTLRIVVLGAENVGKSAITVRFLTKRFIGEYSSITDHTYHTVWNARDETFNIEITDTSPHSENVSDYHQNVSREDGNAFVIIYNVADGATFYHAKSEVERLRRNPNTSHLPILLLGNKTDLEHLRDVSVSEVRQTALCYNCKLYEVSAAEDFQAIHVAFRELIAHAIVIDNQYAKPVKRRRSILGNVSKRLSSVFKRKSLEDLIFKRRSGIPVHTCTRRSI